MGDTQLEDKACPYLKDRECHAVLYFYGPRPLTASEVENCRTVFKSCPDYKARWPLPPIDYARLREAERRMMEKAEWGAKPAFRRASEL